MPFNVEHCFFPNDIFLCVATLVTTMRLILNSFKWIIHVWYPLCVHVCIPLQISHPSILNSSAFRLWTQSIIHAHKWSRCYIHLSPYHPSVCKACGSPPHISAAPPQRCEPQWKRQQSRGCRGCRDCRGCICLERAPQIQEEPGGCLQGSVALTRQPHLRTRN